MKSHEKVRQCLIKIPAQYLIIILNKILFRYFTLLTPPLVLIKPSSKLLMSKNSTFRFFSLLFNRYNDLLIRAPLKTKMITSGLISMLGDTLCQKFIEEKSSEDHSFERTLRQSSVSTFYGAPLGHLWFGTILPTLTKPIISNPARIITSVILDNTLLSSFSIATGVFLLESLRARDFKIGKENMQSKFTTILTNSMKYWCVVSLFNHTFVPVHLKVLVGNVCGIVWQIYMSYTINNTHVNPNPKVEEVAVVASVDQKLSPSV